MEKTQKVLCGIQVGEHSGSREEIFAELRERVLPIGCDFIGLRTNSGTKFRRNSPDKELLYPGNDTTFCDPLFSAGGQFRCPCFSRGFPEGAVDGGRQREYNEGGTGNTQ